MLKYLTKNRLLVIIVISLTIAFLSIAFSIYIQFYYYDTSINGMDPSTSEPAATNEPEQSSLQTLTFSKPTGFYNENIALDITSISDQNRIFYTTDNEIPDANSTQYNGTIIINNLSNIDAKKDKITIIRAGAFDSNNNIVDNKVYTMVYIVNNSPFTQRYAMPVIALTTKRANLYGTQGIITNPVKKGDEWEKDVNVVFFETDGSVKFNIDAGIKIFGGASRGLAQKSFRITARKEYDVENGKFKYAIFPDLKDNTGKIIDKFNSFILRNAGNDSLTTGTGSTGTRDGFMHRLAYKANLDNMAYRPSIVYLNGAYYGILNLREAQDDNYINSHYNIPKENVTVLGNGNVQENKLGEMLLDSGPLTEIKEYSNMIKFIAEKDMSINANYQKASELIDIDSFIRYMAFEIYIVNFDWPHNNVRVWRYNGTPNSQPFQDGRWRYMLKDIDFGFGRYPEMSFDKDTLAMVYNGGGGQLRLGQMLKSLLKNTNFKNKFICYMCDIANYVMEPNSVISELNIAKTEYQPEVKRMLTKYGIPNNYTDWNKSFKTMTDFAQKRTTYYLNYENNLFKLSGLANVTVNKSDKGTIVLSTINIYSGSGTWIGQYFKNQPIFITVIPNEGCSFNGFTITGSGSITNNNLNIESDVTITANFN